MWPMVLSHHWFMELEWCGDDHGVLLPEWYISRAGQAALCPLAVPWHRVLAAFLLFFVANEPRALPASLDGFCFFSCMQTSSFPVSQHTRHTLSHRSQGEGASTSKKKAVHKSAACPCSACRTPKISDRNREQLRANGSVSVHATAASG